MGRAPAGIGPPAPGNAPAGRFVPVVCFVAVLAADGWAAFDDALVRVLAGVAPVMVPADVLVLADIADALVPLDVGAGVDAAVV